MFIVLLVVLVKWSFVIWGCAFGVLTRVAESCSQCVLTWLLPQSAGVPITFLLGFYVSLMVRRWWEQYSRIPWPDSIALYLRGLVVSSSQPARARLLRLAVIRYSLLSLLLCLRGFGLNIGFNLSHLTTAAKTLGL